MTHQPTRHHDIQRVLVITLVANIGVALAKLLIGLLTRSMAMVADGVHSSLDASSNIIGLAGNAVAARPPDQDHPYGHRRFETLASMVIGGFLLLTGWEIVQSSISRLREGSTPHITALNFAAMLATIGINLAVTIYERRAGLRLRSELLLADAEHTRSDVLVSLTVLASLVAVRLGLGWVDAAAALAVVGVIAVVAWQIVSRSANILADRAALEPAAVSSIVERVAGIEEVLRVRSRGPEDDIHVDMDVQIAAPTTAEQSEAIAREVRSQLRDSYSGLSDIQIHFIPRREGPRDVGQIARAEGDALGLGVHEVIPIMTSSGLRLDMHVEVEPQQTVGEAHDLVTRFEKRLRDAIPELQRVVTHIEPAHRQDRFHGGGDARRLAQEALRIAQSLYPDNHWHDLDIRAEPDGGYALSLHCHVDEDMPLEDAHRIAELVETQVRAALPLLHRLTIHTEPRDAAD